MKKTTKEHFEAIVLGTLFALVIWALIYAHCN